MVRDILLNTTGGAIYSDFTSRILLVILFNKDYNNTFDSNGLTIHTNGSEKINGVAADAISIKHRRTIS